MFPRFGLPLIIHTLILGVKFLGETLRIKPHEIKARFLRWGLKINPRLCLVLFRKDTILRQYFAYLIIFLVFFISMLYMAISFKVSLNRGSNLVLIREFLSPISALAVREKNLPETQAAGKHDIAIDSRYPSPEVLNQSIQYLVCPRSNAQLEKLDLNALYLDFIYINNYYRELSKNLFINYN